jgi:hypothetical protein
MPCFCPTLCGRRRQQPDNNLYQHTHSQQLLAALPWAFSWSLWSVYFSTSWPRIWLRPGQLVYMFVRLSNSPSFLSQLGVGGIPRACKRHLVEGCSSSHVHTLAVPARQCLHEAQAPDRLRLKWRSVSLPQSVCPTIDTLALSPLSLVFMFKLLT